MRTNTNLLNISSTKVFRIQKDLMLILTKSAWLVTLLLCSCGIRTYFYCNSQCVSIGSIGQRLSWRTNIDAVFWNVVHRSRNTNRKAVCRHLNLCLPVSSISMNPPASWWCHIFMASKLFNAVKRSTNKIEQRQTKAENSFLRNDYSSLFSCQLQRHSPTPQTSVISYLCLMADQSKLWGDNNSWKWELLSSLVPSHCWWTSVQPHL